MKMKNQNKQNKHIARQKQTSKPTNKTMQNKRQRRLQMPNIWSKRDCMVEKSFRFFSCYSIEIYRSIYKYVYYIYISSTYSVRTYKINWNTLFDVVDLPCRSCSILKLKLRSLYNSDFFCRASSQLWLFIRCYSFIFKTICILDFNCENIHINEENFCWTKKKRRIQFFFSKLFFTLFVKDWTNTTKKNKCQNYIHIVFIIYMWYLLNSLWCNPITKQNKG